MKKIYGAVFILGSIFSASANADISNNWVICDSCTTQTQFNNAAKNWVGPLTGEFDINVGNSVSGVVYNVLLYSGRDGDVISSTPNANQHAERSNRGGVFSLGSNVSPIAVSGDSQQTSGNYYQIWLSSRHSSSFEATFQFLVMAHKTEYIVTAPDGVYGFGSFNSAQMEVVSRYLFNALTFGQPAWQYREIGAPSLNSLLNVLKSLFGKGPTVCIVYNNADVACYQINLLDSNSALYISGTARDIDNQPIPASGGIGGGGRSTSVTHMHGTVYMFGSGGSYYLICNNINTDCYVVYMPY